MTRTFETQKRHLENEITLANEEIAKQSSFIG